MSTLSTILGTAFLFAAMIGGTPTRAVASYPVVDTGQITCYDTTDTIAEPAPGEAFHGQDACYQGHQPSYVVSSDGLTVDDTTTGLTWQRSPDTDLDGQLEPADKLSWWDAMDHPATLNAATYGGYSDWRLPTIKELYSLILFSGVDPSGYSGDVSGLVPFLDTDAFEFIYGDEDQGERIIDSQYWTTTEYVGTTMGGDHTVFGVNFADGRIKGYGTSMPDGSIKTAFVLCVRGNPDYGVNQFVDNGDGTITDQATGLMWMQTDSGEALNWHDALAWAEGCEVAGHTDWRLPDVKELQSIVDYTRSPQTDDVAAIDPVFACSTIIDEDGGSDFPFYWSGTTHANWTGTPGSAACYVAFGSGYGWMQAPFPPFDDTFMDVHGAGCQRSDPKDGDPDDYPYGHGPQGDVIRIFNHVRCVRDAGISTAVDDSGPNPTPTTGLAVSAAPNPFNPTTELRFTIAKAGDVRITVYDTAGRRVGSLVGADLPAGDHRVTWQGTDRQGRSLASGVYLVRLTSAGQQTTTKLTLAR